MTSPSISSPQTIAIVGAGFSGTLVAIHLLSRAEGPLRVYLIERKPPFGGGVAYSTRSSDHLLNVPVERMGAWPENPEDFFQWLQDHRGEPEIPDRIGRGDFVPRRLFGDYIASLLAEARQSAASQVELVQINGEVMDLDEGPDGGGKLRLADGQEIDLTSTDPTSVLVREAIYKEIARLRRRRW